MAEVMEAAGAAIVTAGAATVVVADAVYVDAVTAGAV